MKRRRQIFYWDSSVFVAFFNEETTRSENVAQILEEAESGDVFIITSSFTLVEVIKLKGSTPILVADQKKITEFFEKDYFRFVDANRKITESARDLIWKSPGLYLPPIPAMRIGVPCSRPSPATGRLTMGSSAAIAIPHSARSGRATSAVLPPNGCFPCPARAANARVDGRPRWVLTNQALEKFNKIGSAAPVGSV